MITKYGGTYPPSACAVSMSLTHRWAIVHELPTSERLKYISRKKSKYKVKTRDKIFRYPGNFASKSATRVTRTMPSRNVRT